MEFKTPVNAKMVWIFGALVIGLIILDLNIETFTSFAIGGFTVPIMLYFTHKYTRYKLENDELVIRQFLQKTKRIPYHDIYKIRKIDNPKTMKWIHGQAFPTIEVYYNKFDMIAVLTGDYEKFFSELKQRMEAKSAQTEMPDTSLTA